MIEDDPTSLKLASEVLMAGGCDLYLIKPIHIRLLAQEIHSTIPVKAKRHSTRFNR
jgi:hypothetical protein